MFLKVNDDVAGNVPVDPDDTLKVKKALNRIGRYPVPSYGMTKYPDQPMLDGIKQIQRDHNLFLDGTIKPKGPTESAINKELRNAQLLPPGRKSPDDTPYGQRRKQLKSDMAKLQLELSSKRFQAASLLNRLNGTPVEASKAAIRDELSRVKSEIERLEYQIKTLQDELNSRSA